MFDQLTYKTKNKLLLAAGALFLLMAYNLALKKTFMAIGNYRELKKKVAMAQDLPLKIATLETRLQRLDKVAASPASLEPGETLLDRVSRYCLENGITLRDFPKTVSYVEKNMNVETNVFTIEGPFSKLLRLVYLLEQHHKIGRISSLNFQTREDLRSKKQYLTSTIYIQNLKNIQE